MPYNDWPEIKKTVFKDWITNEHHKNVSLLQRDVSKVPITGFESVLVDRDVSSKFIKKLFRQLKVDANIPDNADVDTIHQRLGQMVRTAQANKQAETAYQAALFMLFYYMDNDIIVDNEKQNKKREMNPVYGQPVAVVLELPERPTISDVQAALSEIGA